MRFKCGMTVQERDAYEKELIDIRRGIVKKKEAWKKKFALFPISVNPGYCRWLEYVLVREVPVFEPAVDMVYTPLYFNTEVRAIA